MGAAMSLGCRVRSDDGRLGEPSLPQQSFSFLFIFLFLVGLREASSRREKEKDKEERERRVARTTET
jgi:hypothetical protein